MYLQSATLKTPVAVVVVRTTEDDGVAVVAVLITVGDCRRAKPKGGLLLPAVKGGLLLAAVKGGLLLPAVKGGLLLPAVKGGLLLPAVKLSGCVCYCLLSN
jgi:hypothetical protein